MKFLLVNPPAPSAIVKRFFGFVRLEPLALETVAGGIDPRHEVRLLDLTVEDRPAALFEQHLRAWAPDVVGLTAFSTQAAGLKHLAAIAKRIRPGTLVIAGGVHATIVPDDLRRPGAIDLVIRGEGATAMQHLVPRLERGQPLPESDVFLPVASPRFSELAYTPPPRWPDLDRVPRPRRDLVDASRYYCAWVGEPGARMPTIFPTVAAVRTSFGCPHRCDFCLSHRLAQGRYLQRSAEDVVAEIAGLAQDYVYLVDDETLINRERARKIAQLLLERGIRKHYVAWARSDTICRNRDVLAEWKRAGLALVFVGIESLDQSALDRYHKGFAVDTSRQAIALLREVGIALHAALIVRPDFGPEDFLAMRQTLREVSPAEIGITVYSPLPGTEFWEREKDHLLFPEPYSYVDCVHALTPTRLPLKTFYRHLSTLYLLSFRENPWRHRRIHPPLRDIARLIWRGMRLDRTVRGLYRDYDRRYW